MSDIEYADDGSIVAPQLVTPPRPQPVYTTPERVVRPKEYPTPPDSVAPKMPERLTSTGEIEVAYAPQPDAEEEVEQEEESVEDTVEAPPQVKVKFNTQLIRKLFFTWRYHPC